MPRSALWTVADLLADECRASPDGGQEPDSGGQRCSAGVPPVAGGRSVRTSCTGSRRPRRAARAADTAGAAGLPLTLPPGCASTPVGWREDLLALGPRLEPPGGHRGRGGFDKGTLAAALIGLMRAGRSQPDPPTSVRAAAPYQIRRSVCAELTRRDGLPRLMTPKDPAWAMTGSRSVHWRRVGVEWRSLTRRASASGPPLVDAARSAGVGWYTADRRLTGTPLSAMSATSSGERQPARGLASRYPAVTWTGTTT